MKCPLYTKKKRKLFVCMRYSGKYYREECPFEGDLEKCREGGGSSEPERALPFI